VVIQWINLLFILCGQQFVYEMTILYTKQLVYESTCVQNDSNPYEYEWLVILTLSVNITFETKF